MKLFFFCIHAGKLTVAAPYQREFVALLISKSWLRTARLRIVSHVVGGCLFVCLGGRSSWTSSRIIGNLFYEVGWYRSSRSSSSSSNGPSGSGCNQRLPLEHNEPLSGFSRYRQHEWVPCCRMCTGIRGHLLDAWDTRSAIDAPHCMRRYLNKRFDVKCLPSSVIVDSQRREVYWAKLIVLYCVYLEFDPCLMKEPFCGSSNRSILC